MAKNSGAEFPDIYEIFEDVPFSVAVLKGPELVIEYINSFNLAIWGCTRESVMGLPLYEAKPELRRDTEAIHRQVYATGSRFQKDEVPIEIGGEVRYFKVSIDLVRDKDKQIVGQIATSIDMTEEVLYRNKLEQSETSSRYASSEAGKMKRLYEAITGSTPDLVYVFDLNYKFIYANPALLAMWGKTWEESIGQGLRSLGYEEWHAAMHEREIDEIIATKKSVRGVVAFPHAELGERSYDYLLSPVLNDHGEVEAIAGITRDITEQKIAAKALRKSEQHMEILRNAVPAMIFYLDKEQRYQTYNEAFSRWFSVNSTEVIGKTVREFVGEAAYAVVSPHLQKAYAGAVVRYETRAPKRANANRWLDIVYTPDKNEAGEVQGVVVLATDITESKMAEMAVRESENRFQNLIREANVGIIVLSGEEMIVSVVNEAYGKLIDRRADTLIGKRLFDMIPESEDQYRKLLNNVRITGESVYLYDSPYAVRVKDGWMQGYLNIIYQPYREANGEITGVVALLQDVTDQVIARKDLEEANERTSLAIEAGGLGTVEVDLKTDDVIISPRIREIFEIPSATERSWFLDMLHPEDLHIRAKAYEKAFADGYLEYESRIVLKDGSVRWIKVKGRIYFDDNNTPARVVSVLQDITDQKLFAEELERQVKERTDDLQRAHQLLLSSNDYLQQIINVFSAPLQVLHPVWEQGILVDFIYKQVNSAYADYTPFTPEELVGKRVSEVFPGYLETDSFRNIRQVVITGTTNTWENHYAADDLDIFNLMSAAMKNEDVVVHMTDFTKLKGLQLELQRKVAELERSNISLEEFAHAASHDLKEPIRKIQFFTDQLKTELTLKADERQLKLFQRIENASRRMASLIEDLLLYSQFTERPLETEDVNLTETIQLVKEDLELIISQKDAEIQTFDLPVIKGYKRQMQQLFQNLVSNAIKYSKPDIRPLIKIDCTIVNGAGIDMEKQTMYYCIRVEDNGIGFQQKYGEQIFQMFQRLHAKGEYSGTGVGLSIARKIVENHRGRIVATSMPDEGAVFKVYIPKDLS